MGSWGLPEGKPPAEELKPVPRVVIRALLGPVLGFAVAQCAGRVGAGRVALADDVVAILADRGGLAAGLSQAAAC